VSSRWRLGEEDSTGKLFIRDTLGSLTGVDARYTLRNGTMVNI
jgi:hypothetical protein